MKKIIIILLLAGSQLNAVNHNVWCKYPNTLLRCGKQNQGFGVDKTHPWVHESNTSGCSKKHCVGAWKLKRCWKAYSINNCSAGDAANLLKDKHCGNRSCMKSGKWLCHNGQCKNGLSWNPMECRDLTPGSCTYN